MVKWVCKECGNQNGDDTACKLSFSGDQPAGAVSVPVLCPLTNELNPEWGSYAKENPMDNGCPKCEKLGYMKHFELCLDCQLEQAEATALQANNAVKEIEKRIIIAIAHEIKQKIKEQENEKL